MNKREMLVFIADCSSPFISAQEVTDLSIHIIERILLGGCTARACITDVPLCTDIIPAHVTNLDDHVCDNAWVRPSGKTVECIIENSAPMLACTAVLSHGHC